MCNDTIFFYYTQFQTLLPRPFQIINLNKSNTLYIYILIILNHEIFFELL